MFEWSRSHDQDGQNRWSNYLETKYMASGDCQVCSNDNPRLTFTYFRTRTNLVHKAFEWEKKVKQCIFPNLLMYDMTVGTIRMYMCQRSRSFNYLGHVTSVDYAHPTAGFSLTRILAVFTPKTLFRTFKN